MAAAPSLSDWLDFLGKFLPPQAHMVIGAGSGTSEALRYLIRQQARSVTLVEADEKALQHLRTLTASQPDWQLVQRAVARKSGPGPFFHATLPTESSVLDPSLLCGIWPNIRVQEERTLDCISLADLLAASTPRVNWLWIDCFPARDLLDGAGTMLGEVEVILARCLLVRPATDPSPHGASVGEVGEWLEGQGFRLLQVFPGWNPKIGTAVFVSEKRTNSGLRKADGAWPMQTDPAKPVLPARKTYHGLHGLDKKMEAYLNYQNGYFIELGANDGKSQSNTLYFEQNRGWRGLLIEPVLHNFIKCRANRSPRNHFACCACVSFSYPLPYVQLVYSNLMTAPMGVEGDIEDPKAHAESGKVHLTREEIPVDILAPARTLTSLLDEAGAPTLIDFLSLDVEGAEIEVLKGIDHQRYRFKYLLIESRIIEPVSLYLGEHGYKQIDQLSHHDYLFAPHSRAVPGD